MSVQLGDGAFRLKRWDSQAGMLELENQIVIRHAFLIVLFIVAIAAIFHA